MSALETEPPDLHVVGRTPGPPPPATRNPPAEKAVLGALLTDPTLTAVLADELTADDFDNFHHGLIWDAIHAVAATGSGPDPVTVSSHLLRDGDLARIGGATYLTDLQAACHLAANARAYANDVREAARQRVLYDTHVTLGQLAANTDPAHIPDVLAHATDTLEAAAARFGPRDTGRSNDGITYTDLAGLFSRPRTTVHWHIAPLIAAGRVTLLYSPGKTGKSLIAMEAAAALTTGRAAFGTDATRQPLHVLYVDQEMTPDDWQDRLTSMGYARDDEQVLSEHLHLAQLQAWPPMDTAAGGAALHTHAKDVGARVVIIDTVSKVVSGEENSNDTAQAFYRHSLLNLKRDGIGTLVLDHTGKDITRGARGGSAKTDNIDLAFELLLRGKDLLTLRCSHARFHDPALDDPTFLRRTHTPLAHLIEDRPATTDHGPGMRPTFLMEKVSRYIEYNPAATGKMIEAAKLGKTDYVRMALALLVNEGYVSEQQGLRRAIHHQSVTPYREDEDVPR